MFDKFTSKSKEKYIAGLGTECPVCDSDNIEGQAVEIAGGSASQEVGCLACHSEWIDFYDLSDIELVKRGTK
jgi:hypothetical protein